MDTEQKRQLELELQVHELLLGICTFTSVNILLLLLLSTIQCHRCSPFKFSFFNKGIECLSIHVKFIFSVFYSVALHYMYSICKSTICISCHLGFRCIGHKKNQFCVTFMVISPLQRPTNECEFCLNRELKHSSSLGRRSMDALNKERKL